ncbi:unnamed protein product, partial [Rotaria socialis]
WCKLDRYSKESRLYLNSSTN